MCFLPRGRKLLPAALALIVVGVGFATGPLSPARAFAQNVGSRAPELNVGPDTARAWINSEKPLTLKDLRGKIVVLDFWTLC
jgi:cytochrome oxidase Cu insertion factor (SCO1/SenC/PrrC family)